MNKRLIAVLSAVVLCFSSAAVPVHAKETSNDPPPEKMAHYVTTKAPAPVPATDFLKDSFAVYELDIQALKQKTGCPDAKSAVIAACNYLNTEKIADYEFSYYEAAEITNFLPEAKTISSIEALCDTISIIYLSKDGKEVCLAYGNTDSGALSSAVVYDPSTDICYHRSGEDAVVYADFRRGDRTR